jgi:hypothetical protein
VGFLNVQQEFRIVRQVAVTLHRLEVGIKLQDGSPRAAGHVKVAGVSERHSARVLYFHSVNGSEFESVRAVWESGRKYMIPAADVQAAVVHNKVNGRSRLQFVALAQVLACDVIDFDGASRLVSNV